MFQDNVKTFRSLGAILFEPFNAKVFHSTPERGLGISNIKIYVQNCKMKGNIPQTIEAWFDPYFFDGQCFVWIVGVRFVLHCKEVMVDFYGTVVSKIVMHIPFSVAVMNRLKPTFLVYVVTVFVLGSTCKEKQRLVIILLWNAKLRCEYLETYNWFLNEGDVFFQICKKFFTPFRKSVCLRQESSRIQDVASTF